MLHMGTIKIQFIKQFGTLKPNVNFRKLELIGGLSDQHRQLLCWTDAVFASLGLRSSGLFRRLPEGPVTLPKIRVNAWITHKIWLCVLVRREFDHFCWLTWWKITDELRKNYGKITHKSLTNHALQRIGTKRPQTGRMRGCAWRIRDGKPRIISALSLVNCVWIAHDSRMNCAKNALKLRSFRAYKTDAAAVPWHSRFNSRRQHIVSSSSSSSPFSSVSGPPKILTISEY